MDVAGGFTTELSLNYVTTLLTVRLATWSGLDGTGDLLATLNCPPTQSAARTTAMQSYVPSL